MAESVKPGAVQSLDLSGLLDAVAISITEAQQALLQGRVGDLQECIARQKILLEQFRELKRQGLRQHELRAQELPQQRPSSSSDQPDAGKLETANLTARRIANQNRVFAAVLRRMNRNLGMLRRATAGISILYDAGAASR